MASKISSSFKIVFIINVLLAVTAFAKDLVFAAFLGTSVEADAYWLAYFLPDLLVNNLLGMALANACIPIFSILNTDEQQNYLVRKFTNILFFANIFAGFLFGVLFFASKQTVGLIAAGLTTNELLLTNSLFKIMIPAVLFFPLLATSAALLQAKGRFVIPSAAPVVFNITLLLTSFLAILLNIPKLNGVILLAVAFLLGIIIMAVMNWLNIRQGVLKNWGRIERNLLGNLKTRWHDVRDIFQQLTPYFLILVFTQIVLGVERYLTSFLHDGSVAALNYAYRISQLPLWVFVSAVNTVILPDLARFFNSGNKQILQKKFSRTFIQVMVLSLPAAGILFFFPKPIVEILFHRGAFDMQSVNMTAGILKGYAVAIVFQSVVAYCLRVCLALNMTWDAFLCFVIATAINIGFDFKFINILGTSALGWGAATAALVNAISLLFIIQRRRGLKVI